MVLRVNILNMRSCRVGLAGLIAVLNLDPYQPSARCTPLCHRHLGLACRQKIQYGGFQVFGFPPAVVAILYYCSARTNPLQPHLWQPDTMS